MKEAVNLICKYQCPYGLFISLKSKDDPHVKAQGELGGGALRSAFL